MDRLPNLVEEAVESFNPREHRLPAFNPSEAIRSERQTPAKLNEALLRIAQDMARILDELHESIKKYRAPTTTLQQVTFCQLVQDAMKVGTSEISNQERS